MFQPQPNRRVPVMVSVFKRARTNHQKARIDRFRQQMASTLLDAIRDKFQLGLTEKDIAEMLNVPQKRFRSIVAGELVMDLETLVLYNMRIGNDVYFTIQRSVGQMQL